jgi:hypothetical protein
LVDFWGKPVWLYFYDLIRSKMSRNCILSVTELSFYYICHFYKIDRICSYAEAAFIKTIAVFTASTYWKDVFGIVKGNIQSVLTLVIMDPGGGELTTILFTGMYHRKIDWLIEWGLTPLSAVFQLYRGGLKDWNLAQINIS